MLRAGVAEITGAVMGRQRRKQELIFAKEVSSHADKKERQMAG